MKILIGLAILISFVSWPLVSDAAIPYKVTLTDSQHALSSDKKLILQNLDAAIKDWARFIRSRGTVWIHLDVTTNTTHGRFTGGSTGLIYSHSTNGLHVYELSGPYKLRTGKSIDVKTPDILIQIHPEHMRTYYWIDPNPKTRSTPVPAGKIDLVTVFAHEVGHGFGLQGFLDLQTGKPPSDSAISTFDNHISFERPLEPVFLGPVSSNVNGTYSMITFFTKLIPYTLLTHGDRQYAAVLNPQQNLYHLGRYSMTEDADTDLSFFSVMCGSWQSKEATSKIGWRVFVNELDAAVLKDIGIPANATVSK